MKYLCALLLAILLVSTGCQSTPPDDLRHRILVSTSQQRLSLYRDGSFVASFPVSTSKFGLGDLPGSNYTPLGKMRICEKIGGGAPLGMKFKDRLPTGEIVPVNSPGRDPIVTRILRLQGLEPQNAGTYGRYIYIHGTPEEAYLGQPRSYGCIRMSSREVKWLYDQVGVGARVEVQNRPLPPAGMPLP